ncbi:hypothetical protein [Corallococcus sp. 4LFB]|uniref:hypothetical protein n=1 Tax=Corallococcus sp. 4LFB TaxID=3383249 RepID=UPI003976E353
MSDGDAKVTPVRPEPNGPIVLHKLLDAQFMEMGRLPLPDNWVLNNGPAAMSGPGNVNVYVSPLKTFMFSHDPMMQRQNGQPMRPFVSMEQVLHEDLLPQDLPKGSRLVNQFDAPPIARADKSFSDLLYKVGPVRELYLARMTEWMDRGDQPYLTVIHLNEVDLGMMVNWNYHCHALNAPTERYAEIRDVLLNALANIQYNPEYVRAYNQQEQARVSAS